MLKFFKYKVGWSLRLTLSQIALLVSFNGVKLIQLIDICKKNLDFNISNYFLLMLVKLNNFYIFVNNQISNKK